MYRPQTSAPKIRSKGSVFLALSSSGGQAWARGRNDQMFGVTLYKLAYSLHSEREVLVYCLLKLLGASNACLNPFLYGYLNENFRQEYRGVKKQWCQVPRLVSLPVQNVIKSSIAVFTCERSSASQWIMIGSGAI